jgi:hypothetical protein
MISHAYVQVFRGCEAGESLRRKTSFHMCENIARFPGPEKRRSCRWEKRETLSRRFAQMNAETISREWTRKISLCLAF